jgi:Cys-Gly metallodipeptidase DUG1
MADWLANELESLGATVEKRPLGKQELDGVELDLPPALLGQLGNDPNKVSVLFGYTDINDMAMR